MTIRLSNYILPVENVVSSCVNYDDLESLENSVLLLFIRDVFYVIVFGAAANEVLMTSLMETRAAADGARASANKAPTAANEARALAYEARAAANEAYAAEAKAIAAVNEVQEAANEILAKENYVLEAANETLAAVNKLRAAANKFCNKLRSAENEDLADVREDLAGVWKDIADKNEQLPGAITLLATRRETTTEMLREEIVNITELGDKSAEVSGIIAAAYEDLVADIEGIDKALTAAS